MRTVDLRHRGCDRPRRLDGNGARLTAIAVCAILSIDGSRAADDSQFPESFEVCTACHSYQQMDMGGVRNAAERAEVLDFLELLAPQKPTVATAE